MALVALLVSLLVSPVVGVTLRQPTPKAIHEKWDKMDDFLEVMFTMACRAKHGKDVNGLAAEKLSDGKVTGSAGYQAQVDKTQGRNIEGLKKACGLIDASGKKKCRQGCADRWAGMAGKRVECDGKCVKAYAAFEKSCATKVDDLDKVYDLKDNKAEAQQKCYKGHCKEFPQVWMMAEDERTAEVETRCASRCTDDNVKAGCQKKWLLDGELVKSEIATKCDGESEAKECYNGKKASADTNYDTCQTDTTATCDAALEKCNEKGTEGQTKGFCGDRKKMCMEQADKKCLNANRVTLETAVSDCQKEEKAAHATCVASGTEEAQVKHETECIAERGPKCKKDCSGKCEVAKMGECLVMLKQDGNPGKSFCKDFWRLLSTSSEVDPMTGNPIVLLSSKSSLAPVI